MCLEIRFRDIDLADDRATLLAFARDLFLASFGDPDRFERRFGFDGAGYVEWMLDATSGICEFASFAVVADEPIGMVVLGFGHGGGQTGHVYHYYLSSAVRGCGLGAQLNDHAIATLGWHGMRRATLHVAPQNSRAIGFYRKLGWCDAGFVRDKGVRTMTFELQDQRGA